jgi:uroporphyrinogen-III synthase
MTGGVGPLAGRRILVTRRPEQAGALRERLTELDASVVEVATLDVGPPDDPGPLHDALRHLHRYHWVLFTSTNAVRFVAAAFARLGLEPARALEGVRVGSVGPSTGAAIAAELPGVPVALQPEAEFRAEGLAAALGDVSGQAILFPSSDKARDVLPATLEARGATVEAVVAYRTLVPPDLAQRLEAGLSGGVDLVTFASPSAVEGFVQGLGREAAGVPCAVIGPVTAQAARAAGLDVRATASPSTAEGLVEAILALLGTKGASAGPSGAGT